MSSMTFHKKIGEFIPTEIGVLLSYLPFKLRLGRDYKQYQQLIEKLLKTDSDQRKAFIIDSFKNIVNHFKNNNDLFCD